MVEISQTGFVEADEPAAFSFGSILEDGQVVGPQYHILGRNGNGFPVFGCQDVVDGHHQHPGFSLGFRRQRQMDSIWSPSKSAL